MAVDGGYGPRREPRFDVNGAPDLGVDENEVAKYAAEFGNYCVDTAAKRAAAAAWAWDGLMWCDSDGTKAVHVYRDGAWRPFLEPVPGTFGSDANATIGFSTLIRTHDGMVSLQARTTRTNGSSYAVQLILGVLPIGFRPAEDAFGKGATYGSGTPADVIAEATTGIVRLMAPAPAGHTAARFNLVFKAA